MRNCTLHLRPAVVALALLPFIIAAGCNNDSTNGPGDSTAPTVSSTLPANSTVGGATNATITATFSEAMAASTISAATFTLRQGATSVPGIVTFTGRTATFVPTSGLALNSVYSAAITIGAEDTSGNAMENEYNWSFTTRGSYGGKQRWALNSAQFGAQAVK